ncbi:telomeric repeat-binding factor 1 [Xyrichtys novacula]|uniref:Telomeric repeat-binding factor n=1 Tax=Xyrichtys novacula TaxID=13765 RepID=A0AAV1H8U8_XYRNO|nr:telomeric repeat-binding factor 1 [Xyrichtys novacula]
MEPESNNKTVTEDISTDESVSFPRITAVVTRWTLDFTFVSLCRYFKEGKIDEFDEMLSIFEAISLSPSLKRAADDKKTLICAFLARILHGKQLDVQYEEDANVTPLVSAANIWSDLKDSVADKKLVQNVGLLLLVQSVAVCLEKGQRSSASSALKWFEENYEFPESFRSKLLKIMTERETYHPLLTSFSFSRLKETIQSFLDDYLEKNPSDYLLKAATKVAQSSEMNETMEDVEKQDSSLTEMDKDSSDSAKENSIARRPRSRRKHLFTKTADVWKPDSCKKVVVCVTRLSKQESSQTIQRTPAETSMNQNKRRKARQKWTEQLDRYLVNGVQRHGEGKWSHILLDYDFQGRTGTMLKDRWRTLMKTDKFGDRGLAAPSCR